MIAPNDFRPIILVRGFDPLGQSSESTYYGFNDGTVYPQKMGEDYIYEGMLLKFLKTRFPRTGDGAKEGEQAQEIPYLDATNAIRYTVYRPNQHPGPPDPRAIASLNRFLGREPSPPERDWLQIPVILDPDIAEHFRNVPNTLWVFRYYDFKNRDVAFYAEQLEKTIAIVEAVTGTTGVNLICHSMGGVIARHLIQKRYANKALAEQHINKWVTLGTPHRGIAFSPSEHLTIAELEYFNATVLKDLFGENLGSIDGFYDPNRVLCVVGTNHRAYNIGIAGSISSGLNQIMSWLQGQDQNHSDGLVKQKNATLIGAHRADVFKCHGGQDSLITSREAFELAHRFFFGDVRARIRVKEAEIKERYEGLGNRISQAIEGKPEFYIGFSVKPRNLDFFLHHQDKSSENCFGPIDYHKLTPADFVLDPENEDPLHAGLIFEGFFNSALAVENEHGEYNLVFRFDTYVGERDAFVFGHSDTEIVDAQSYFEAKPLEAADGQAPEPVLDLLFYPKLKERKEAKKCRYLGTQGQSDVYELTLEFGELDPDFRITFEITIEGPWNAPQEIEPAMAPHPDSEVLGTNS